MKYLKHPSYRKLDPESEYYRECPSCKTPFMAKHQLQKFCPQKDGKPNYCKYRYKALKSEANLILKDSIEILTENRMLQIRPDATPAPRSNIISAIDSHCPPIQQVVSKVQPPKDKIADGAGKKEIKPQQELASLSTDSVKVEASVPDGHSKVKAKTLAAINKVMDNLKQVSLTFIEIEKNEIDLNYFDKKTKLPHCNLFMIEIGNYGILWTKKETITIIHLNELLWI